MKKLSYPVYESYHYKQPYNVQKWLKAFNDLNYFKQQGKDAFNEITHGWKEVEKQSFINWMKFYQEGNHLKYKKAQSYYTNGDYFLPLDGVIGDGPSFIGKRKDEFEAKDNDSVKNDILKKLKAKILARLKAAERLLEHEHAHDLIGDEYESVLDSIYQLRKTITKLKKTSKSGKLYQDLIVREGNKLSRDGFYKGATYLYKIAQMPGGVGPGSDAGTVALPNLTPTTVDGEGVTNPGDANTNTPTIPEPQPEVSMEEEEEGVDKFISKLNGETDESESDSFEVDDEDDDDLIVEDMNSEDMFVAAQLAPQPPQPTEPAQPLPPTENKPEGDITIEDDDPSQDELINTDAFDNVLDSALKQVTIHDVIRKVEQLSKVFKTREIPRQLSVVDLMLNKLDMANYFPELSEATNKSLESNNYIAIRIDSVLARLYSAMNIKGIDLTQEKAEKISNPEVDAVKSNLTKEEEIEKLKQQQKKEKQNQSVQQKETPAIEVEDAPSIEVTDEQPPQPVVNP